MHRPIAIGSDHGKSCSCNIPRNRWVRSQYLLATRVMSIAPSLWLTNTHPAQRLIGVCRASAVEQSSSSSRDSPEHRELPTSLKEAKDDDDVAEAGTNGAISSSSADQLRFRRNNGISVRVDRLVKHFWTPKGTYRAVNGIDLEVKPNELLALLGPSGSGKTTLLRMIAGLEEPTSGSIFFDGVDVTAKSVKERNIGFVFQGYALFKHMNVAQNISFAPRIRKWDIDVDKRVAELLELVDLPGLGERMPNQLSGGQRQRVALARALASEPRILLMDEPFGALDPIVRVSLRESLKEIVDRVGITTILVTHDQEEAYDIADRVAVFNKGLIEQLGTPQEVYRNPASPFVMDFVGECNVLPASSQLVRRMGYSPPEKYVMFRPDAARMIIEPPQNDKVFCPATITDKRIIGDWVVKYFLECDDGLTLEFHTSIEEERAHFSELAVTQRIFIKVPHAAFLPACREEIDEDILDLLRI